MHILEHHPMRNPAVHESLRIEKSEAHDFGVFDARIPKAGVLSAHASN